MSTDEPQRKKGDEGVPTQADPRLEGISESERIRELRDRLYSRGNGARRDIRHQIPDREVVATKPVVAESREEAPSVLGSGTQAVGGTVQYGNTMTAGIRRKSFRKKILILGVLFFVIAMSVASVFMLFGKNAISPDNISLSVSGPIAVGGGEEISFQVSVANQNTIAIQSATLIIEYPDGTHSATEINKEISVVRETLNTIGSGELVNVPFKARVFGEENEEKEIKVSIEYRVEGSNATFDKEATPLRFKVSTSPVIMTFDSVKSTASGQDFELKLTLQSNSPAPLSDIIVKLVYPDGFDFNEADPETVSGEDTWKFAVLKPGEKKVITIQGLMTGYEDEARKFTASAGVANTNDKNTLASVLAKSQTEVVIERSFLDVNVSVNGASTETVVINPTDIATVEVKYTNALNTAIYNGEILVELSGNALNEFKVKSSEGFYDSSANTVRWDSVDVPALKEILPGQTSSLSFTLDPKDTVGRAPLIKLSVTVKGARVFEERAPQELAGTAERTIKIESVHTLESYASYSTGPFKNTGPVPPVAEEVTQYTYTLAVTTGSNDVTGGEVTAVLPSYVKWLDLVTDGDKVTYNASTRTVKWTIGDIDAHTTKQVSMQVSFLPSLSQVGTTPTILQEQRFKATDRFTGTVVRSEFPALTTSLQTEEDKDLWDGKVRSN